MINGGYSQYGFSDSGSGGLNAFFFVKFTTNAEVGFDVFTNRG